MDENDDAVGGEIVPVPMGSPRAELALSVPFAYDENPARVYLSRLTSTGSRRVMADALTTIATTLCKGSTPDTFAWHRLRYRDGMALRATLAMTRKPRTVNRMISALRGVLEEAINLGHMTDAEGGWRTRMHGIKYDKRALSGRALETTEVAELFGQCDRKTLSGARDTVMLSFLFGAGLRRSELAGIHASDIDSKGWVTVLGKGAKTRTVQLAPDAIEFIDEYIAMRGHPRDPIVVSFTPQGEIRRDDNGVATGLTATGVYDVLQEIAKRAGVTDIKPHDARRSRITEMISQGMPIALVKQEAGHESSETTDRYDRTKDKVAHDAAFRVRMLPPKKNPPREE